MAADRISAQRIGRLAASNDVSLSLTKTTIELKGAVAEKFQLSEAEVNTVFVEAFISNATTLVTSATGAKVEDARRLHIAMLAMVNKFIISHQPPAAQ